MGQEVRGKPEAPALSRDPERSIGAYLTRQRELRGISLDELATLTRIPRRSLERLESGVFDRAPDGFVRGFVRTVASALGLDPDETVMRLLSEPPEDGDEAHGGGAAWASPGARWIAAALGACLVAGFVAWLVAGPGPEPAATPADDGVVLRHDLIRELASQTQALPAQDAAAPPAGEAPPGAAAEPAEPGGAAEPAEPAAAAPESAQAQPEVRAPAATPGEAAPAAPPAAPDPAPIP